MEWVVVLVIVVILLTLVTLRRSGWDSNFTFPGRYRNDLTQRTRMAEDEVRDAIDQREKDIAP